jgi:hypothetical protein
MTTPKIAGRDVRIEPGEPTAVPFSRGALGEHEAGLVPVLGCFNDDGKGVIARCRPGADPGERFRIMEGDPVYAEHWPIVATSISVRPAKKEEVDVWRKSHPKDIAIQ